MNNVVDLMTQAIAKTVDLMSTESAELYKYECYEAFTKNLNENLIKITEDDLLLVKDISSTANSGSRTLKVFRNKSKYDIGAYFTVKISLKLVYKYKAISSDSLKRGNIYQVKQAYIEHCNEEFIKFTSFKELFENQKQQVDNASIKRYQEITGSAYTQFKDAVAVVEKCIAEKREIDYFTMTVLRQFSSKYNNALENLQATEK